MPVLLAATLALASPLSDHGIPGSIWVFGGAGASIHERPGLRINGGGTWYPYPKGALGGLNRVGLGASIVATIAEKGNTGILLQAGYGRPLPSFWIRFEAGVSINLGWEPGNTGFAYSPTASLRIGYNFLALRVMGFITGGKNVVFHNAFYGLTLEGNWEPWAP